MPRVDTVRTVVYKFSELSPTSQQKAIDKWCQQESENLDIQPITDMFREYLDSMGYEGADRLEWSLAHCQGDGVAFYGHITGDNLKKVIGRLFPGKAHKNDRAILNKMVDEGLIDARINTTSFSNHYSHWNTMDVVVDAYHNQTVRREGLINALQEAMGEDVKTISRKLEKDGYEEIEYLTSEEQAQEYFTSEGVEFREDGRLYR